VLRLRRMRMPNYVYNSIIIEGNANGVDDFVETVGADHPFLGGEQRVFSFLNIISPTMPYEEWSQRGAGWNMLNWGTRRDAFDARIADHATLPSGEKRVQFYFDTAWSSPTPIMEQVVNYCALAGLALDWHYEEETGWGGDLSYGGGVLLQTTFDVPQSHAEYHERDRSCPCEYQPKSEPCFDDCSVGG
jgi:hypothetical protein